MQEVKRVKKEIPEELQAQAREYMWRLANSVTDEMRRRQILEMVEDWLCNSLDPSDVTIDGDTAIVDNEDSGYWVSVRVFVYYPEVDDYGNNAETNAEADDDA
jgi:hypothetical protein